ncbi:MAG: alpha/beta fold hydrolase [Hoeflea sp.]|uniref:alpha/beta fold hydrolase n=1 Tax=Hoeflea sp. TaxID=1940281 RepID=UPI0027317235|nr:alpha/beta fold hydrolase [Hoeflea sp.]MDP2121116.1 alpha/beta fold hydrolase [Hoeflea sp.]
MFYLFLVLALAILGLVIFRIWTLRLAANAVKTAPQLGAILPVAGGTIHHTDTGPRDGQAVVLIHGLAGNLRNFNYGMVEDLSREFRVIVIDRPGSGYSRRDADGLAALPAQAAMVWELLDKLGVEKPVLVGHSLGGALALSMALDARERVGALALLCPLTAGISEPPPVFKPLAIRSGGMRRFIGHTLAAPISRITSKRVLSEVFAPETAPDDFMSRGGGALGLRPEAFINAAADLNEAHAHMPVQAGRYATDLDVPGGILFGAGDNLLSPQLHGQPMEAFGLSHETLPGRGHMIPVTAPRECAEFVRRMAKLSR